MSHRNQSLGKTFQKVHDKVQATIEEGNFSQLSKGRRKSLMRKLTFCTQALKKQNGTLPAGLSAGVAALILGGLPSSLQAQDDDLLGGCFADVTSETNEFDGVPAIPGGGAYWFGFDLADLDGDGDQDLIIGTQEDDNGIDRLFYFENQGSCGAGTNNFQPVTSPPAFPFSGIQGDDLSPEFVDLDNDGDLDLVLGDGTEIRYFENTGNATNPVFSELTGANNPFSAFTTAVYAHPYFADLDGDGDQDLILGNYNDIRYFENTGDATNPVFSELTGANNPFDGIDLSSFGGYAAPALADFCVADPDRDGDLDLFIGTKYGNILFYANEGDSNNPVFVQQTGANNPFDGLDLGEAVVPVLADLDCDGDMDIFVGEKYGNFKVYRNECNIIPTMGQWAFFLSILSVFNLFIVGLYNLKKKGLLAK